MKYTIAALGVVLALAGCAGPLGQVPEPPLGEARTAAADRVVLLTNPGPGDIVSATLEVQGGRLVAPLGAFTLPLSADLGVAAVVQAPSGATVVVHGFRLEDGGLVRCTLTFPLR